MSTLSPHWLKLIERARWAPSADNTQPWRFEALDDSAALRVHYRPGTEMGVFCLDHYTGHLAMGGLLETLRLAALDLGYTTTRTQAMGEAESLVVEARIETDDAPPDPLAACIEHRATQRRLLSTRPLTASARGALQAALPTGYQVVWLETPAQRRDMARLMSAVGKVRLLMPETYPIHRDTIEWGARMSEDRIPSAAIGADPMVRRIMGWALRSPRRVDILNRLWGHLLPRFEMDYLPARACAAHFLLVAHGAPDMSDARLAHGAAMQRFWLAATLAGLQLQPEMAALVFARYLRAGIAFTVLPELERAMRDIDQRLTDLCRGTHWLHTVFMGRLGYGPPPVARSLRKPLSALLLAPTD